MSIHPDHDRLAQRGAAAILAAFEDYEQQFMAITRLAKSRFERRDWHGMQHDAVERLELYGRVIARIVAEIRELLGASVQDKWLWAAMKAAFSERIPACDDFELTETFFNSVTRRIFATVGVDPKIEFLFSDFDARPLAGNPVYKTYANVEQIHEVIKDILEACSFSVPFENLDR